MRELTGRIPPDAVEREIVKYLALPGLTTPVRSRAIVQYVVTKLDVSPYEISHAWYVTLDALRRLRYRGVVQMTGIKNGARYSLAEQKAVANG